MMPNTKLARQLILAWHQQINDDIVIGQAQLLLVRQAEYLCLDPGITVVI